MRIVRSEYETIREHNLKQDTFLTSLSNIIFMIYKNDDSIDDKLNLNELDGASQSLLVKIEKQKNILNEASKMRSKINTEIEEVANKNEAEIEALLEQLGSEL